MRQVMDKRFDGVGNRFDEMKSDINRRIGELETDTNGHFDELKSDMDRRFGELKDELKELKSDIRELRQALFRLIPSLPPPQRSMRPDSSCPFQDLDRATCSEA